MKPWLIFLLILVSPLVSAQKQIYFGLNYSIQRSGLLFPHSSQIVNGNDFIADKHGIDLHWVLNDHFGIKSGAAFRFGEMGTAVFPPDHKIWFHSDEMVQVPLLLNIYVPWVKDRLYIYTDMGLNYVFHTQLFPFISRLWSSMANL